MRRLLLLLLLPSCFCDIERPPPPGLQGSIAGRITVDADASYGGFAALPPITGRVPRAALRAGDAVVLFAPGAYDEHTLPVAALLRDVDADGAVTRCTARRYCVVELTRDGKLLDPDETRLAVDIMRKADVPRIQNVSCNMMKRGFRLPDDSLFSYQWNLDAIGAAAAWELQLGDPDLHIAIIDSGIVHAHPDLNERIADGVDLVSADIDLDSFPGRDTDPEDPGDHRFGTNQHSFHGTHVAGIIGAESDNTEGVAGVTWAGRLLPVRVLGHELKGYDTDIMDGIYWAIGDPDVLGVPANPTPARVVNLSLGGPGVDGSQEFWAGNMDYIFQDPDNRYDNPLFVAAAGNTDQDAATITPANIAGMITVGATTITGARAHYSNYGGVVDIMAPGGDGRTDLDADGRSDAILSTVNNDYDMREGTSMAAPHVTGVVALLLSNDPSLTQLQVEGLLRTSANPDQQCTEGCGAGGLDAVRALLLGGGEVRPAPFLATDRAQLTFPLGFGLAKVRLLNLGNAPYAFATLLEGAQADLFSVTPATGTVAGPGDVVLEVRVARGSFESGAANLNISTTDLTPPQSASVSLAFADDPSRQPRRVQSVEVAAFDAAGARVATTLATRDDNFAYQLTGLRAGSYSVRALADDDNDGAYETGESFGVYPTDVAVPEDTLVPGIDFSVDSPFIVDVVGGIGQPCAEATEAADCTFAAGAECIPDFDGGYCSRACAGDGFCGSNGRCEVLECGVDADGAGIPCSVCLLRCSSDSQCRFSEGYLCDDGECVPGDWATP